VVLHTDAVTCPEAVVVEFEHAVVAELAVGTPRWPADLARAAELQVPQAALV